SSSSPTTRIRPARSSSIASGTVQNDIAILLCSHNFRIVDQLNIGSIVGQRHALPALLTAHGAAPHGQREPRWKAGLPAPLPSPRFTAISPKSRAGKQERPPR